MLRNPVLWLTLISIPGVAWADPAASARFKSERVRASQGLVELRRTPGGGELTVDWPVHRTRPAAIRGLRIATVGENDEARARGFLARHGAALAVEPGRNGNRLRLVDAQRAHGLRAIRFQLEHRGLEVLAATVIVALDDAGRVTALSSEVEPIALTSIVPAVTGEAALATVQAEVGARGHGAVRLAILAEGTPRLIYRVRLPYPADPGLGRFHLVDAASGRYLGFRQTGVVESFAGREVRR